MGKMELRFRRLAALWNAAREGLRRFSAPGLAPPLSLGLLVFWAAASPAQMLIQASQPGEPVNLNPADMELLEADESRRDLPCQVTPAKPELGFDLRFHAGYTVALPLKELEGTADLLTVIFRVYPEDDKAHAAYFVQHFNVPAIDDNAKGDASLTGSVDLGVGNYHVDWLIRDHMERSCSSSWDYDASLPPRDKPMGLFIGPKQVAEAIPEPFVNDGSAVPAHDLLPKNEQGRESGRLSLKLLVNFAPQQQDSAALTRTDTDALVTILKTIERDPHVAHISLVAFNMEESRILYRQDSADSINLVALGKTLESMKLGTVNVQHLDQKRTEADFLAQLMEHEVAGAGHTDAVIIAGPKAMLDADVPQEDLRRIGDIECPVFYMNYNLHPQAAPWKDSISHAIRAFKGTEYTISRPRDLWFSTSDILDRILRSKQQRVLLRTSSLRNAQ
jgi:hypothetical protein